MTLKWTLSVSTFLVAFMVFPIATHAKIKRIMPPLPVLTLPIDCALGKNCFIQNYVDLDPSKGVKDAACGKASYNGHKGTDFALLSMAQMKKGVRVIAAAPGRVLGIRQNMPDILIKNPKLAQAVKGRECGNGIVVQHADGWQTQYCHLARGSIKLRKGQKIKRGQRIGLVGLSGMTQFPHVHLSLRHHKKVVDPFLGLNPYLNCKVKRRNHMAYNGLWRDDIKQLLPKQTSFISVSGFSDHSLSRSELRINPPKAPTSIKAPALILYTRIINVKKGDRVHFQIFNQQQKIFDYLAPRSKGDRARQMQFSGKKKRLKTWKAGHYKGIISLMRDGQVLLKKELTMTLR